MFRWIFSYLSDPGEVIEEKLEERHEAKTKKRSERMDRKIGRLELKAAKMEYMAVKCQVRAARCPTRKQKKWERRAERCTLKASTLASKRDATLKPGAPMDSSAPEEPIGVLYKDEENNINIGPPAYEEICKQPPAYEEVAQAPPLYPVLM